VKRVVDNKFEVGQFPLIHQKLEASGCVRGQVRRLQYVSGNNTKTLQNKGKTRSENASCYSIAFNLLSRTPNLRVYKIIIADHSGRAV
jgi:hypothetical protein